MSRSLRVGCLYLVIGLCWSAKSEAGIIVDQNTTGYAVSNSDLLQTEFSSVAPTGTFQREGEVGETALRDGGFGDLGGQNAQPPGGSLAAATAGTGDSLIYTLNTSGNPGGYNITSVATYAGWDGARYAQHYDVSFHLTTALPGVFTTPITVNYQPTGDNGHNTSAVITPDAGPFLAAGVDQVQFVFHNADSVPAGGYQGYRELDVFGAAVPEPATVTLFALSAIGLVFVARRRK